MLRACRVWVSGLWLGLWLQATAIKALGASRVHGLDCTLNPPQRVWASGRNPNQQQLWGGQGPGSDEDTKLHRN